MRLYCDACGDELATVEVGGAVRVRPCESCAEVLRAVLREAEEAMQPALTSAKKACEWIRAALEQVRSALH